MTLPMIVVKVAGDVLPDPSSRSLRAHSFRAGREPVVNILFTLPMAAHSRSSRYTSELTLENVPEGSRRIELRDFLVDVLGPVDELAVEIEVVRRYGLTAARNGEL